MARYVRLEDISVIGLSKPPYVTPEIFMIGVDAVYDRLEKADQIEVIKCKDCKHVHFDGNVVMMCHKVHKIISKEDFCSEGEEK